MAAKKTFRELYDEELRKPTAAQQFIRDVSELTHRSEVTVRFWLSGRQVPDELAQTIIAKKYNVDVKCLPNVTTALFTVILRLRRLSR